MNINLVEIDANKTVGKNPVLVDVAPSYVYENGKRTGEVRDSNTPLPCLIRLLKS